MQEHCGGNGFFCSKRLAFLSATPRNRALTVSYQGQGKLSRMLKPFLTITLIFFGLLLHPGLGEPSVSTAGQRQGISEAHKSTSDSSDAPFHHLLHSFSSISTQPLLPQKGVSCKDLMPDALEHFDDVPQLPQTIIRASLALALQSAGCSWHAESLVLHLFNDLGQADANALLLALSWALSPVKPSRRRGSSDALMFNMNQLARRQAWRCKGFKEVNGSTLHGQVHSTHGRLGAAIEACHRLRDTCAGVAANGTDSFQVIVQNGSYFLPHHGHQSWLHQCRRVSRGRRATQLECRSEAEQHAYDVIEWIPVVSTYYSFGTSIYYASKGCTELAKERALEGVIELGYDALVAATGGSGSLIGLGVSTAVKPAVRIGLRTLISHFFPTQDSLTVPSNYTGPVTIV